MAELKIVQLSSLHKVLPYEDISALSDYTGAVALKGERVSYQVAYKGAVDRNSEASCTISCDSRLSPLLRMVGNVPCAFPTNLDVDDDFYLSKLPGLYPDVLFDMEKDNYFLVNNFNAHSIYITLTVPEDMPAGDYVSEFTLTTGGRTEKKQFILTVLDAVLPKQSLTYTQWFHADCIATYYGYEILSEEHWAMIEKFIAMAARTGINLLLTPVFTLPLDTGIGKERPTLQLVAVNIDDDGKYSFDFTLLTRWLLLCKKYGIEKIEISHLFSQWGTGCTPKIVANTPNGEKKIFGWHTKALSPEYDEFLGAFLPALTVYLTEMGVYDNTYFHVSDEPEYHKHYDIYTAEKALLTKHIPDDKFIDACSDYRFYEEGIIPIPAAITTKVEEFFAHGHTDIWAYTCGDPHDKGYSNRMIAMPNSRNRITGIQLYKYGIKGFLHWGFNFYNAQLSRRTLNPFLETDAGEAFPSGDSFSVYPGNNGPIESLRSVVFFEGLQDISACELLESYIGREAVLDIINAEGEIKFNEYPRTDAGVLGIRDRINAKIKEVISK